MGLINTEGGETGGGEPTHMGLVVWSRHTTPVWSKTHAQLVKKRQWSTWVVRAHDSGQNYAVKQQTRQRSKCVRSLPTTLVKLGWSTRHEAGLWGG